MSISILLVLILTVIQINHAYYVSMNAWVEPGYYFSHRCEITLEVISDYFENQYQLFHVLAKQNANFFLTQQSYNVFYIKGTNSIQSKMTPSQRYCRFPMSTTYYCPFISLAGYDPYGISYFDQYNSSHRKLTIRINRAICPSQNLNMTLRLQMPTSSDYNNFYMYVPSVTTDQVIIPVDKLSFVYDQQINVNLTNLKYKQIDSITFPQPINYLIGCKFVYTVNFQFNNLSYYNSWSQINVYISNQQVLSLSTDCQTNLALSHSCVRTDYGFKLVNNNQISLNKSYEIAQNQYYQNDPMVFAISFGSQFINYGQSQIQVVCKASNNAIQETWLNMSHNNSQIYGKKIVTIEGFTEGEFNKISQYSTKLDPLKCIIPITSSNTNNPQQSSNSTNITNNSSQSSNNTSQPTTPATPNNNSSSQSSTNSSNFSFTNTTNNNSSSTINNNNNTNYNFNFQTTNNTAEISQLIFILGIILVISFNLFFRLSISIGEKIVYLFTIFPVNILKVLGLVVGVDQTWLISLDQELNDSLLTQNNTYSLELFILQSTFLLQFILNAFYFLTYIIIIIFSKEITQRIKSFYGNKIKTIQGSLKKCSFSSFSFCFITFLTFLFSYKIYGGLIFKLHLHVNTQNEQQFKKYRFKNSSLYKIHSGHLGIDLFLQVNALIWTFFLLKNCQNQYFTYFLYIFFTLYCVHTYLMAVTLKSFFVMAAKSDELNALQQDKMKNKSLLLQSNRYLQRKQEENIRQGDLIENNKEQE